MRFTVDGEWYDAGRVSGISLACLQRGYYAENQNEEKRDPTPV